jgi:hypothetical protein
VSDEETFEGELFMAKSVLFQWEPGKWLNLDHVVAVEGGQTEDDEPWLRVVMTTNFVVETSDVEVIGRFFEQWDSV